GSTELEPVLPGRVLEVALSGGELIVRRGTDLFAQPFDPVTGTLSGTPTKLATNVQAFAAASGTTVWWAPEDGLAMTHRIAIFSRTGERLANIGRPASFRDPRLSRDGMQLAVARADVFGQFQIWTYDDIGRGVDSVDSPVSPFSFVEPVWSPDGEWIVAGPVDVARFRVGIEGRAPAVPGNERPNSFTDWSANGVYLLGETAGPDAELRAYSAAEQRPPIDVAGGEGAQIDGAFSPDSRWVAFTSMDGDQPRVYVTSFPMPGPRLPVAAGRGKFPRWRHDGRELFFEGEMDRIIAVPVRWLSSGEPSFGMAEELFRIPDLVTGNFPFDVFGDGQRLVAIVEGDADRTPLQVRVGGRR
ncbi:MAG TPA: hypothetical protein VLD67_12860, partial [Vicinamibacterales bacterium]|nr:hypothetical protein [Vicinamibacterales bacterium]